MDRLTAMKVFVEIVERGSMSAAAEALNISRAMISRYLEGLEGWLGVRLLHRTTRRLTLTDAGEQALKTCREMVNLTGDIEAQVRQTDRIQGKIRLTSSTSFAQAQLTAAVVDFQERHPGVVIELVMMDRTVDLVQDRIDLAIRLSNHLGEGLVARRLAVCHSVLCASPGYLKKAGTPTIPEDLHTHRQILHINGFAASYNVYKGEEVSPVEGWGTLAANETSILLSAVLAGAGIAMLPTYLVEGHLMRGTLMQILPDYTLDALNIHAVYLSRRHQPQSLRLLIEFLAERFGGDVAPWDRTLPPVEQSFIDK